MLKMEAIRRDTDAAELAEQEIRQEKGALLTGAESKEAFEAAGANNAKRFYC